MIEKKVKVYSTKTWLPRSDVPFIWLTQLNWGRLQEEPIYEGLGRFENFFKMMPKYFEWVEEPSEADFWIIPADYKQYKKTGSLELLESIINEADKWKKWPIIQYKDDGDDKIPYERLIVLRTSFYRSTKRTHEYAMPVWTEDIGALYNNNYDCINPQNATIGFTGMAYLPKGFFNKIRFTLRYFLKTPNSKFDRPFSKKYSTALRYQFLNTFLRYENCICNFEMRSNYLGGSWQRKGQFDLELYREIRKTFIENLQKVDYVADYRGGGNYTLRFYETLCAGKIPVVLDSDRVFPLEELIDWEKHALFIPFQEIKRGGSLLNEFHIKYRNSITDIKKENRKLWEEYLSPEGFYLHMFMYLKAKYL